MVVLTGPPGSGKTHEIFQEICQSLAAGRSDFRFLVPSATMAEYIRNRLAREGHVFHPRLIQTFSKFMEELTPDRQQASDGAFQTVVDQALESVSPACYTSVADLDGFRRVLANLIEELSLGGCDPATIRTVPGGEAIAGIYRDVENRLARRGLTTRAGRLTATLSGVENNGLPGLSAIYFDGFSSFSNLEIRLLEALAKTADLTITLPDSPGSATTLERLLSLGFQLRKLTRHRPEAPVAVIAAPDITSEAEEVARRILSHHAEGVRFREMGVVLRSEKPYVPLLETTFERFGIPARFYFSRPLSGHPVIQFLKGGIDAALGGWEHEALLPVLRFGAAADPSLDRFEFKVRRNLPARGIAPLREMTRAGGIQHLLENLERLDSWRGVALTPPKWERRIADLAGIVPLETPRDGVSHNLAALWRSRTVVLRQFQSAVSDAACTFDPGQPVTLDTFWRVFEGVLRLNSLRVPDHRRDVVHVMDAIEARQWELRNVFVCGLLEKQFPRYHSESPLLSDESRELLNRRGFRFRTTADRQQEEQFLFDVAVSRATAETVLSYPVRDPNGEDNLPSFLLSKYQVKVSSRDVRPQSGPPRSRLYSVSTSISDSLLQEQLRGRHAVLRPTAVETFLQCPFRFFGRHTLKLDSAPAAPEKRLDALLKGTVVHAVMQRWHSSDGGMEIPSLVNTVVDEICSSEKVPDDFRKELARIEIVSALTKFAEMAEAPEGWKTSAEEPFELRLEDDVVVSGRIDRLDVAPDGRAIVFDYKYSGGKRLKRIMAGHENHKNVQVCLYLLAASRVLGHEPAGMFYWSLKGDCPIDGWHVSLPDYEKIAAAITSGELMEMLEGSETATLEAASEIRAGRIAPTPDPEICRYCEFRDVCRARSVSKTVAAGDVE